MEDKCKKKLISTLKNHKLTADGLAEEMRVKPKDIPNYINELYDEHIEVDRAKQRGGREMLYHINMLPEVGNIYQISGKDNIQRNMKFGLISDLHIASKYHLPKTLRATLKRFRREYVKKVFIPGDIVDGVDIYRGHRENLITPSFEDQTDMAAELFSEFPSIEFWGVAGNHDYSYTKKTGARPLQTIEAKVDNFKNLGDLRADVVYRGIKHRLLHGGSGRTYARSYPTQTYLRDLFGGSEKRDIRGMPEILLVGHYHTKYQSRDHGIEVIQPGSFQDGDNEYCIRKGLTGPNGGFIIDLDYRNGIIDEFSSTYIQPREAMREKGSGFRKTVRNYRS